MDADAASDVLAVAFRLFSDPSYHDIEFVCTNEATVTTNRAFVCAANPFFHKLLRSGYSEAQGSYSVRLHAEPEALKSILHFLYIGKLPADLCSWSTLMDTACLAHQYMLPAVIDIITKKVEAEVTRDDLGVVLSKALQADLQAVVRNLWLAASRLMPMPLEFDRTFSADAISFCLQHTAWISSSGKGFAAVAPAAGGCSTGGTAAAINGTSNVISSNDNTGRSGSSSNNTSTSGIITTGSSSSNVISSSASCFDQEAAAFNAVLSWMLADVEGCSECRLSRHHHSSSSSSIGGAGTATYDITSQVSNMVTTKPPLPCKPKHKHSDSCSSIQQHASQVLQHLSISRSSSLPGSVNSSRTSSSSLSPACSAELPPAAHLPVPGHQQGSFKCCNSLGEQECCSTAAAATGAATAAAAAGQGSDSRCCSCCCWTGECCSLHQHMLLQLLACLNWHLLSPSAVQQLESLALLGPASLLALYRAQQRCSHLALQGSFASLTVDGDYGLRCYTWAGEQVLECDSPSHITASSALCFTAGRHCWQIVVDASCDLAWVGVSNGNLDPDCWGGKQPGGWFYGSNDALCHNSLNDRQAYSNQCGFGPWRDKGAVIDVLLDMEAREVWFSVDGAEPRLGFSALPDRVYPAVSVRAPARLLMRFRQGCMTLCE